MSKPLRDILPLKESSKSLLTRYQKRVEDKIGNLIDLRKTEWGGGPDTGRKLSNRFASLTLADRKLGKKGLKAPRVKAK